MLGTQVIKIIGCSVPHSGQSLGPANPGRSSIEMWDGRVCNLIEEISLVEKPKVLSNTLFHTTGTSQSILRTPYQRNIFVLHFKVKVPIVKVSHIKGRWT
jgi:hypothetical protein